MKESMALMNDEYYAARITVVAYGYDISDYPEEIQNVELPAWIINLSSDDKKVEAEKVVFGKEYQNKKDIISDHMQTCLSELEIQMETEQANVAESLKKQVAGEHILTVILIPYNNSCYLSITEMC